MFIDVHCHIDFYEDAEVEKIVERARKVGVGIIIDNGVGMKTNTRILELAGKYKEVKAALGLYPIDALKLNEKEINLELGLIRKNRESIIAIGEVGLDYKEDE